AIVVAARIFDRRIVRPRTEPTVFTPAAGARATREERGHENEHLVVVPICHRHPPLWRTALRNCHAAPKAAQKPLISRASAAPCTDPEHAPARPCKRVHPSRWCCSPANPRRVTARRARSAPRGSGPLVS